MTEAAIRRTGCRRLAPCVRHRLLILFIAAVAGCREGIDVSPAQARSICDLTSDAFTRRDSGDAAAILELHLGVAKARMRTSREGIYIPSGRNVAEERGYLFARPGVVLGGRDGDPSFELVEGCLYRYRIKG